MSERAIIEIIQDILESAKRAVEIVVVIDGKRIRHTYTEMQKDRMRIGALLMQTRKRIPMDIVVYTAEECRRVREDPTDFIRKIEKEAVPLL